MQNISQEPVVSSKGPNQHLTDMDALCTIKFNLDNKYLNHCCINDE